MRHSANAILLLFVSLRVVDFGLARAQEARHQQTQAQTRPTESQLDYVKTKVLPLLKSRCFECHNDGPKIRGGLSFSSRRNILKGGDSGPAVVPGKPNESLLIEAVRYESFEMPPRTRMPREEVAILERWIEEGAFWPAEPDSEPVVTETHFPLQERKQAHWAWQPIENPTIPDVADEGWVVDPADAFVLAKLEAEGLSPAVDADRRTIVRRLYFDLIGLPPTVEQIEAFVNDPGDDQTATAAVVDDLLASPHFGERWGRHWLDLVRYAETLGHEFDYPLHHAWRYRDYVIRAFNADVPYDQLVREHIAGDLLASPRRHPAEQYNESVIGTGFWFLHEDKHAPVDVRAEEAAKIDNQLDVFSKTFLGLTVTCARCHDHKFDAISTEDYYALSGFLQSSRRQTAWLDRNGEIEKRRQQLREIRSQAAKLLDQQAIDEAGTAEEIKKYVLAALEVVHQASVADATPVSEENKYRRGVTAVAGKTGCDETLLNRWVTILTDPKSKEPRSVLSFLARLAQADPQADVAFEADRWRGSVNSGREREAESVLFADLQDGIPDGWFHTGMAFEDRKKQQTPELRSGQIIVNSSDGVTSSGLSHELRGTLTSPTFELKYPEILVRVAGEGCRMRLVIDGYLMFEHNALLFNGAGQKIDTKGEEQWLRFGGDMHRYQGHRVHLEFLDEGAGWLSVKEVRFASRKGAPPPGPASAATSVITATDERSRPSTITEAVHHWLHAAQMVSARSTSALINQRLHPGTELSAEWQAIANRWMTAASRLPVPQPVIALTEGTPENERVFIRGSHKNLGPTAGRNILTALRTSGEPQYAGSGRLELVDQMLSDQNPFPARVAVNRIWHHLFGKGIVETTDNFGVLGKAPTHPQLLDHLAFRFRSDGWSFKTLIRAIVLSRSYRMSGQRTEKADRLDPANLLLHRARVRRLTGEAIRDAMLTVSGRLDRQQFGAPVPVKLTPFMQGRGRPRNDGPLDGNGRRSIYIAVNRNFLSPFMLTFDVPAPVTTTGKRTTSNVPAQALIMLNNDFVSQQAGVWADRLLAQKGSTRQTLAQAWYQLFGRPISDGDLTILLQFVQQDANAAPDRLSRETLTEICHTLLNSKEFLFLR